MNKKEWQAIEKARELFKLGDKATLGEMKRAYHRMCKQYHPDKSTDNDPNGEIMYQLTEAYDLLMRYAEQYRFPLSPGVHDVYDAEEWWMDRFGEDPLWSQGKRKRR